MSRANCNRCKFNYIGVDKDKKVYTWCYRQPKSLIYWDENVPFCESFYKNEMISEKEATLKMYRNGSLAGKFMPVILMYNAMGDNLPIPYGKTYLDETYIEACCRLDSLKNYGRVKY